MTIESNVNYKKTDVGYIPSDWEVKKLKEVAIINADSLKGKVDDNYEFYYYDLSAVEKGKITGPESKIIYKNAPSRARRKFKKNDILMSTVRPYLQGFAFVDFEATDSISSTGFAVISGEDALESKYLYYNLFSNSISNQIKRLLVGSNYPAINTKDVENLKVPYPNSKHERGKIAQIFTTWDSVIEHKEKLLKLKKDQKKGLIQNLLTGKVRISGYEEEWKKVRLGNLLKEVNEKSTENNQFRVLSVTKSGIVSQDEHFKKQVASENNEGYKIVRKNNLVFSSMNLWMGSLDVLTSFEVGIVSPAYKVFEFYTDRISPNFAKYFMRSEHMVWLYKMNSEQGASIVRRNLDLKGLLNTNIKIPTIDEQKELASILMSSDKEINLIEKEIEELQQQKKALMQQLLTGKVRVKV